MLCLGIESSCDETAAAVIEETGDPAKPWAIRSSVIASQVAIHREWGGVVPELASRQHIRDVCGVLERALDEAHVTWKDLGAIAVTQGPGLVGSLLVGYATSVNRRRSTLHTALFAVILTVTTYVIVDLEFPRLGLIRVNSADQVLLDLRASMR